MPFTLSGKTGKLVIEVTEDSKEKKNKVYTCKYTRSHARTNQAPECLGIHILTDGVWLQTRCSTALTSAARTS